ncbi:MAG: DinB family protein [Acidobacteriaceae bacterium]
MQDSVVREQLIEFLQGKGAHASTLDALKDFPAPLYAKKLAGAPHNAWQLLEHIRFTLHDLLDFCTNPAYRAPKWPEAYWPAQETTTTQGWNASVKSLRKDFHEFEKLLQDPGVDLYARIPWGKDQTILREALLAIDHTSYHVGQLLMLRKQLGAWKD